MVRPLKLDERLQAVANLIPHGSKLLDIGTDHARLPVYLLEQGKIYMVIATDIAQGPLESAYKTASNHQMQDKIDFRKCDGATAVLPDEIDTAIVAGMGGETIISILQQSGWLLGKRLILQPMSKKDLLENWLVTNGYNVTNRIIVEQKSRKYLLLCIN